MKYINIQTQIRLLAMVISLNFISCGTHKIVEIKENEKISDELSYKFDNSDHFTDICVIFDKTLLNENIEITQNRGEINVMKKTMSETDFKKNYTYLFLKYKSFGSIINFGKSHYFISPDIYSEYRFIEIFKKEGSKKIFFKFTNTTKYEVELNVYPGAPPYDENQ